MSQSAAEQVARRVLAADPGRPTDVLDLPHGASLDDVRKAYRKLARDLHPDKNPSPLAVEAFRRCG
jgi:preprotein translocase subunit Sec63